ncbi:hypothetical protein E2562_033409 [Oryza meyeriana var. granulata]|uniref:Uncharacterized protein n=1 Tax=Oryza meyeriana var. granulata TaxID=110450 RepID=A0A6G1CVZ5_9ORYZ|nr:hypothetical protein E2562_033409 [Oryza meyeriana var. granulata]
MQGRKQAQVGGWLAVEQRIGMKDVGPCSGRSTCRNGSGSCRPTRRIDQEESDLKQLTSGVCSSSLSGNSVGFRPTCVVVLAGVARVDVNDGLLPGVEVESPRLANVWFCDILAASREP